MSTRGPFAKVFRNLWDGSMARKPEVWALWVFMLAHANAEGVVDMSHDAIAGRSGLDIEAVRRAIAALEGPDPESRTPGENGARIMRLDAHRTWGWQLVNYRAHRTRSGAEREADRRERQGDAYRERERERKRAARARLRLLQGGGSK